jgi:predicted RNA-binding protein with PIN domain
MRFLIDGYNLLHAMGLLKSPAGPRSLEKARLGLLGLLASTYEQDPSAVTVVFDAAEAPANVPDEYEHRGIRVRFAVHEEQADELIEKLIQHHSAPRQLTVVSDDHRIQQAARRRHCNPLGCGEYLDSLYRQRRQNRQQPSHSAGKPQGISESDRQHWLREFIDLETDPALRDLSDPREWGDIDS